MLEVQSANGTQSTTRTHDELLIASQNLWRKLENIKSPIGISQKIQDARNEFESLKSEFDAIKYKWFNSEDLRGDVFECLFAGIRKLVWFISLDLGRILKKSCGTDEYYLVNKLFNLDVPCFRRNYELHKALKTLGEKIDDMGRKIHCPVLKSTDSQTAHTKQSLKQSFYWGWQGLRWLRVMPKFIEQLCIHLLMLPLVIGYAPRFFSLWIFLFTTSLLPLRQFVAIIRLLSLNILIASAQLLSTMRLYCFGFSDDLETTPYQQLTKAITPTKIDWSKFGRGVTYQMTKMFMDQYILFYYFPVRVKLFEWAITGMITGVYILISTLCEEVEFRRPAAQQSQSSLQLVISTALSSVLFAAAHLWNPEFKTIGNQFYSILALSTGYCLDGLFWAMLCYFSGGLELSWGLHFANNLFLSTIIGYQPSPIPSIPLLKFSRGVGSEASRSINSVNSAIKLVIYVGTMVYNQSAKWIGIYFAEILFARHIYAVPELASNPVSDSALVQKAPSERRARSAGKSVAVNHASTRLTKMIIEISQSAQRMFSPIGQTVQSIA